MALCLSFLGYAFVQEIAGSKDPLKSSSHQRQSLSSTICEQCSSISACTSAQSDLRATLSASWLIKTLCYNIADSVALRSDCADGQADLKLHWAHMSEDLFSDDAAQI